jgi:hypothetical protein
MRSAPQSIVAQQKRYALGVRLWSCLQVLPIFLGMGLAVTTLMVDPSLSRSIGRLLDFVILASLTSMLLLKPWGRAARCRNASKLLGSQVTRYEMGESLSDADLAGAAEQAAQIMLAPLPALSQKWTHLRDLRS